MLFHEWREKFYFQRTHAAAVAIGVGSCSRTPPQSRGLPQWAVQERLPSQGYTEATRTRSGSGKSFFKYVIPNRTWGDRGGQRVMYFSAMVWELDPDVIFRPPRGPSRSARASDWSMYEYAAGPRTTSCGWI